MAKLCGICGAGFVGHHCRNKDTIYCWHCETEFGVNHNHNEPWDGVCPYCGSTDNEVIK